jgi:hypothetical protein
MYVTLINVFVWVAMSCGLIFIFNPEDGDSMFHRNIGIYLQIHTTSQSRKKQYRHVHSREDLKSHT